jgi:hypothetical protein
MPVRKRTKKGKGKKRAGRKTGNHNKNIIRISINGGGAAGGGRGGGIVSVPQIVPQFEYKNIEVPVYNAMQSAEPKVSRIAEIPKSKARERKPGIWADDEAEDSPAVKGPAAAAGGAAEGPVPKKRGRPLGSKNKPKIFAEPVFPEAFATGEQKPGDKWG